MSSRFSLFCLVAVVCLVLNIVRGVSRSCGRMKDSQDNPIDSKNLLVSNYFMNLIWGDWAKRVLRILRSTLPLPWVLGGRKVACHFPWSFFSPPHYHYFSFTTWMVARPQLRIGVEWKNEWMKTVVASYIISKYI